MMEQQLPNTFRIILDAKDKDKTISNNSFGKYIPSFMLMTLTILTLTTYIGLSSNNNKDGDRSIPENNEPIIISTKDPNPKPFI